MDKGLLTKMVAQRKGGYSNSFGRVRSLIFYLDPNGFVCGSHREIYHFREKHLDEVIRKYGRKYDIGVFGAKKEARPVSNVSSKETPKTTLYGRLVKFLAAILNKLNVLGK